MITGADSFLPSEVLKLKWEARRGTALVLCGSIGRTGSAANVRTGSLAIGSNGSFLISRFLVITGARSFVMVCAVFFVITCTMSFAAF